MRLTSERYIKVKVYLLLQVKRKKKVVGDRIDRVQSPKSKVKNWIQSNRLFSYVMKEGTIWLDLSKSTHEGHMSFLIVKVY